MPEKLTDKVIAENLVLRYITDKENFEADPFAHLVSWFHRLELFYDELTEDEFKNTFTICECTVDLQRKGIHNVRDRTDEEPFLRTYILLFTNINEQIFVVGVCRGYDYHLHISEAVSDRLSFDTLEDTFDFLNELSEQKFQVSRERTHFFTSSKPEHFQIASLGFYQTVLRERLENNLSPFNDDCSLIPSQEYNSQTEHAFYMYLCFAASASDSLVDRLVKIEREAFSRHYSQLLDVPWLRHEFLRRYLGVDWPGIQTHFYREIFVLAFDTNNLLYNSATYAAEHCYTDKIYADFFVKVPPRSSPMSSQFHCIQHENKCSSRLSLDKGSHIVPYGLLEECAFSTISQLVRRNCNKISRVYSTFSAFNTWLTELPSPEKFTLLRVSEEPEEEHERYFAAPTVKNSARRWYERLTAARENPSLVCSYDKQIIDTVIIPFWDTVSDQLYFQRLCREYLNKQTITRISDNGQIFHQGPLPTNYNELIEYADLNWSPCINNLVQRCRGSHLEHHFRLLVIRFLLSPLNKLTIEQAAALWELFWTESDAYAGVGKFWSTTSEHARTFESMCTEREKWKFWPACAQMIKHSLCPFTTDSSLPDIEEAASPMKQKQRQCVNHMHANLARRGRRTKFNNPFVSSPMSYATCTQASFEVKN